MDRLALVRVADAIRRLFLAVSASVSACGNMHGNANIINMKTDIHVYVYNTHINVKNNENVSACICAYLYVWHVGVRHSGFTRVPFCCFSKGLQFMSLTYTRLVALQCMAPLSMASKAQP